MKGLISLRQTTMTLSIVINWQKYCNNRAWLFLLCFNVLRNTTLAAVTFYVGPFRCWIFCPKGLALIRQRQSGSGSLFFSLLYCCNIIDQFSADMYLQYTPFPFTHEEARAFVHLKGFLAYNALHRAYLLLSLFMRVGEALKVCGLLWKQLQKDVEHTTVGFIVIVNSKNDQRTNRPWSSCWLL